MLENPAQLLDRLEESGLLSDSIVECRDSLLKEGSAEMAASELVRLNLITEFQAEVTLREKEIPLVIGDYIVEEMLGKGGMGYVLKARHRRMKRAVAIKFLLKSLTDSDDFQKRFEREVEAAAQLDHQNIVTAYDAGVHDGNHFLVMQYVDGDDLSRIVKTRGPLSVTDAVDVIRQAAEGLECAHEIGIVHRDIKPSNLLMDHKGVVRVLDMGLARIQRSPGDAIDATGNADLTGTGSVLGTVDYMAPEQALDAKKADHRADIYSLGCTLYFLLAGNPPFGNETIMRRLLAHRQSKIPRLSEVRPEVPDELEQIYAMMMAKRKRDRHPSMKHLVVALNTLELSDAEADQMATLDMPEEPGGAAESFGERPDLRHAPKATVSVDARSADPKRRKRRRRVKTATSTEEKTGHSVNRTAKATATLDTDRSLNPDTESVARDETFAGTRRALSVDSLKARLTATTLQQRGIVAGAFSLLVLMIFAFSGDSSPPASPSGIDKEVIVHSTSPARRSGNGASASQSVSNVVNNEVIDLFDGKSLDGWQTEGGSDWTVKDGILTGSGNSLIVYTKEKFEDARVTVECRVPSGSNSGVFIRHEYNAGFTLGKSLTDGFEAQISTDHRQPTMTGGIYGLKNVKTQFVPDNTWFTLEFEAVGDRLKVRVDGVATAETTSSKFVTGHVALQAAGTAHFRKVQVQRLNKPSADSTFSGSAGPWSSLFNGRNLDGWQAVGNGRWAISDGVLKAREGGSGWLATDEEYADYEFECEFQMSYGANSGIFIHADPAMKLTASKLAEIQLLDTTSPAHAKFHTNSSHGALWNDTPPTSSVACLPDKWYRMLIRVVGSQVTAMQDGQTILNATLPPGPKRNPGRIGLQAYGQTVSFRNLRVRHLND